MARRPTTRLRVTSLEDRLTPAGGLDSSFGTGGVVVSPLGDYSTRPSVLAQPDGHILVVNGAGAHGTQITRYNADGSLDTAFGDGGTVNDLAPGLTTALYDAAVGPDGKVTLSGTSSSGANRYSTAVVRLNADGTPDAGFGTNGVVSYDATLQVNDIPGFPLPIALARFDLALLADGSVVVVGDDHGRTFTAVRLTPAGAVDPTFGVNGLFTYAKPAADFSSRAAVTGVVAAPDGGVFLLGSKLTTGPLGLTIDAPLLLKLTPAGVLDTAFDGDGVRAVPVADYSAGLDLAAQPDGKLLVATSRFNSGFSGLAPGSVEVLRLNADGSLDTSFGGDGLVEALPDGGYAGYGSLGLLPDGRVVVASGSHFGYDAGFAVLNADGTPDDYFADGSGAGGITYATAATGSNPQGSSLSADGLAVTGDRVVVLSSIYGADYYNSRQNRLGLAVLTEGPTALSLPHKPPVIATPPQPPAGGGEVVTEVAPPVFADPSVRPTVNLGATIDVPALSPLFIAGYVPPQPKPGEVVTVRFHTPGDVNGDGVADKVVTDGAKVSVVSGKDGSVLLKAFAPFEASYTGTLNAVFVDANGDGVSELVVSPGQGGGPVVAVYNADGTERGRFWGIDDTNFRGGVNLAVTQFAFGDGGVTGLIVAAGAGGGPRVAVFDASTLGTSARRLVADFFAFESGHRGGVVVADGHGTLVFGAGAGGGPRVRAMYTNNLPQAGAAGSIDGVAPESRPFDKFVGDPASRQGVTLAVRPSTANIVSNSYYTQEVVATAGTAPPEVVLGFDMFIAEEARPPVATA